jgi:hypothetical protein
MNTYRMLILISFMVSLSVDSGFAQNTKNVTQQGENNRDLILQQGDNLTVDLFQFGTDQVAMVVQQGKRSTTRLSQAGTGNLAWVMQLLEMDAAAGDTLHASQSGFNNTLLLLGIVAGSSDIRQTGDRNSLLLLQQADSTKTKGSRINVKQTGSGNRATIIQN